MNKSQISLNSPNSKDTVAKTTSFTSNSESNSKSNLRPIDKNIIKHLSIKFAELETGRTSLSEAEIKTLRRVLKQYEQDCSTN